MKSARLSEIFARAAELIRDHGHYKGFFANPDLNLLATAEQPLCAVGALRFAQFGTWALGDMETQQAQEVLRELLMAEYPEWCAQWRREGHYDESWRLDVPSWNDDPNTTPQQVIDLLELAAAKCRPDAYTEGASK